jgi:NitT/TauT family transport system permease protein
MRTSDLAHAAEPPAGHRLGRTLRSLVAPIVGLAAFFGLWELIIVVFDVPAFELPPPSRVFEAIADDPGFYLRNAWVTGREAALGFGLALFLALVAGTVMTYSRFLERAVQPVAVLVQVTPIIAYAPAFVIWLGAGIKPIIAITTLVCFVPFLFNAVAGLRSVDPATLEVLRSVDASVREIFLRLRLPHALPYLFAAARIAVGLALIGAVLGEWFALVDEGLGVAIRKALNFNDVDQLWASILVLGFLGGAVLLLLTLVERVALHWHPSQVTLSAP